MNHQTITITAVVLLLSFVAHGQADVITWQTESMKILRNNEEFPFTSTFKIYPNDRVEWDQGTGVDSFTLTSTEGDLPQAGLGSVTYNLVRDGKTGKIIIERLSEDHITLTLDMAGGTNVGAYCLFKVFNP